jgi:hypothetical protein
VDEPLVGDVVPRRLAKVRQQSRRDIVPVSIECLLGRIKED